MILRSQPYSTEEVDAVDVRIKKTTHPLQEWFVFDPNRYVSLLTGRGGGKTTAQLMRFIRCMVRTVDANCLFIAATRESAERLIWRELKRLLEKLRIKATYSEAKLTCTLRNGATLRLFGCDDKKDIQKLRGISYHEVGVDEVASINVELLRELIDEVIGPRLVGALCLMGTPGKALEGQFYESTRPNGDLHRPFKDRDALDDDGNPKYADFVGWSSHAWTVHDGASHGIAPMIEFLAIALLNKAKNKWSDTNPYWLREYMGQWIMDESVQVYAFRPHLSVEDAAERGMKVGAEWNIWDPKRNSKGFAILPEGITDWAYATSVDIGWKDAVAIETYAFSYTHPSRTLYHVHEVYRGRLYAKILAQILIGEALDHSEYGGIFGAIGGWPVALVGDFSRSGHALLKELSEVYGITITPADKPYAYKNNSIELTNSFLHEGQIKVLKGSGVQTEMTTLQWVVDEYGKRTENPNQDNHGSDATIYMRDAVATLLPSALPPPATPKKKVDDVERPREPEYGDADAMYDVAAIAG